MTIREKLESMAADGTLVEATLALVEAVGCQGPWFGKTGLALAAFEPSPTELARDALRKAGFVEMTPEEIRGETVGVRLDGYWRLEGGKL